MTIPQPGEIWRYESSPHEYENDETWLIINRVNLAELITVAVCLEAMHIETGDVDNIYIGERSAHCWTRLA